MISAILPSSLLAFAGDGRVSLPDLRHLTALTELRLDMAVLSPAGGQLPHLPNLRVLSFIGSRYVPWDGYLHAQCPGPQTLGLADATPLLAEVRFAVGNWPGISDPHEQLATLAPLAQLQTIVLDFWIEVDLYRETLPELFTDARWLLRHDTLLSLPLSVTKLVLCRFDSYEPAIALPENIVVVFHEKSLLD